MDGSVKRALLDGTNTNDWKRPKSNGDVVVLARMGDYGNAFNAIIRAMKEIDRTLNFNMKKLSIPENFNTYDNWIRNRTSRIRTGDIFLS